MINTVYSLHLTHCPLKLSRPRFQQREVGWPRAPLPLAFPSWEGNNWPRAWVWGNTDVCLLGPRVRKCTQRGCAPGCSSYREARVSARWIWGTRWESGGGLVPSDLAWHPVWALCPALVSGTSWQSAGMGAGGRQSWPYQQDAAKWAAGRSLSSCQRKHAPRKPHCGLG